MPLNRWARSGTCLLVLARMLRGYDPMQVKTIAAQWLHIEILISDRRRLSDGT
jgi:hypothetical protein